MKSPKKTTNPVSNLQGYKIFAWVPGFLKLAAAALLGSMATLWGSTLDYWNQDRELDIRMVDVALIILSGKNENTKSQFARAYALKLLEEYAGVTIDNKDQWALNGDLPVGTFPGWFPPDKGSFGDVYRVPSSSQPRGPGLIGPLIYDPPTAEPVER